MRISGALFGDAESVGDGVYELKFHIGPGYRAYYIIQGRAVVVMLTGGDKSTQKSDIRDAKELASNLG